MVDSLVDIEQIADVRGEQIINISSDDITFNDWLNLARKINELSKNPKISGFVITHGTNTMEETAFFLNLTIKTDKPVVITGSMRPNTSMSTDGTMNLFQAIALAANENAMGKGVLVCFSDGIYSARDVQKINCFKTQAFNGADYGCVGVMQDNRAFFQQISVKPHTIYSEFSIDGLDTLPRIDVVYFHADAEPDLLAFSASKADGIILAGAGAGLCSKRWKEEIKKCTTKGIPVVRASRISNGIVTWDNIDDEYGTLPGYTLPASKLRILLALTLLKTRNRIEIHEILKKY